MLLLLSGTVVTANRTLTSQWLLFPTVRTPADGTTRHRQLTAAWTPDPHAATRPRQPDTAGMGRARPGPRTRRHGDRDRHTPVRPDRRRRPVGRQHGHPDRPR